ncbi:hypothetical protein HOY82DRAFT_27956 [Tuber indicum]|nr:hypothetical protein HOY82DRAFT_27956 [Tuber indicum]
MELRTGAESGRGDQFRTREGELWKITSVLTIAMEMVEADIGLIRGLKRSFPDLCSRILLARIHCAFSQINKKATKP